MDIRTSSTPVSSSAPVDGVIGAVSKIAEAYAREQRMPTSEQYKRRAEECRALAEQTHDDHERASILRMAEQWDILAKHKAKKETEN